MLDATMGEYGFPGQGGAAVCLRWGGGSPWGDWSGDPSWAWPPAICRLRRLPSLLSCPPKLCSGAADPHLQPRVPWLVLASCGSVASGRCRLLLGSAVNICCKIVPQHMQKTPSITSSPPTVVNGLLLLPPPLPTGPHCPSSLRPLRSPDDWSRGRPAVVPVSCKLGGTPTFTERLSAGGDGRLRYRRQEKLDPGDRDVVTMRPVGDAGTSRMKMSARLLRWQRTAEVSISLSSFALLGGILPAAVVLAEFGWFLI